MSPPRRENDPLTHAIIGAAQKIHRDLGPGFNEVVYHRAMLRELLLRDVACISEPEYEVWYEGTLCGTFRPDLVVSDRVVVELKAVSELGGQHRMQTLSYLKASGLKVALLINFGGESLEVRRFVN